jgi:hypothetical protein
MQDELVRILDINLILFQNIVRKVLEIASHDDTCSATNCGGEYVAIVRVRSG